MDSFCFSCATALSSENYTHGTTFAATIKKQTHEYPVPICNRCWEFPDGSKYKNIVRFCLAATDAAGVVEARLNAILDNLLNRYHNPRPVIIGLIFTELHEQGGKVLIGRRAINPYKGEWALVSGYMEEKHGGWRGTLATEASEEVSATVFSDYASVKPYWFESTKDGRLLLNFAIVPPDALRMHTFEPNEETSEREEFAFDADIKPELGIEQHQRIFNMWHTEYFK